jgi:hypothetical protein
VGYAAAGRAAAAESGSIRRRSAPHNQDSAFDFTFRRFERTHLDRAGNRFPAPVYGFDRHGTRLAGEPPPHRAHQLVYREAEEQLPLDLLGAQPPQLLRGGIAFCNLAPAVDHDDAFADDANGAGPARDVLRRLLFRD